MRSERPRVAGTDYDFRVRAVPSDTDRYETSAWSDTLEERTSGTAPPTPTTPTTSGGMGDLNVTCGELTADSITWNWSTEGRRPNTSGSP